MDNVFLKERKVLGMKEIGKIRLKKVMASIHGKMEENTKEHTKMIKGRVKVSWSIMRIKNIKEVGKTDSSMELDPFILEMKKSQENGLRANIKVLNDSLTFYFNEIFFK